MDKITNYYLKAIMEIEEFKKHITGRGELFEELVALILKRVYPQYKFEHTSYKCDGGKDFYSVDGDINIWAEAKSHSRHLELGRIAGTFIMADICQISRIIIFSLSPLTKGAIVNLTKYCSNHGKTLIVYNDEDILNILKSQTKFEKQEILDNLAEQFDGADRFYSEINAENFKEKIELYEKDNDNKAKVFAVCAYILFNLTAGTGIDCDSDKKAVIIEEKYFLKNREELSKSIRAFEYFSAEIIVRNENMYTRQSVNVKFQESLSQYRLLGANCGYSTVLQPGQCGAAIFYFRALNDSPVLNLPKPIVTIENTDIEPDKMANVSRVNSLPCLIVGETSFLGQDLDSLNLCCNALKTHNRMFETVVIYGKSGVGKSRFIYEMQTARFQDGNNCFVFHGDCLCNSTYDFFRQLLLSYYDIFLDSSTGKVELPSFSGKLTKNESLIKNLNFIEAVLNDSSKNINATIARNWLVTLIKNSPVSLFIDNAQILSKDTISLLYGVISDLQGSACSSEIVLSFNTDLMMDETSAGVFFKYIKNKVQPPYKIEVKGFDYNGAVTYLKESLDPKNLRNDLWDLCEKTVSRVGTNPLMLKQIVLYLFQKKVIGFRDETLCILKYAELLETISELPETVHETVSLRYALLSGSLKKYSVQLTDLLWEVLIFGELPEQFVDCIQGFNNIVLKNCIELGFLKYSSLDTIVFEHQLISKSVLLLLEGKPYNWQPSITALRIGKSTARRICKDLDICAYPAAAFVLTDFLKSVDSKNFEQILLTLTYDKANPPLIPYVTELVGKHLKRYNSQISVCTKIKALTRLIHKSQDVLGVQRTQLQFRHIIEFQILNYNINIPVKEDFIELLKFYMYELPVSEKDDFLDKMSAIGEELLRNDTFRDDFRLWIKLTTGKNRMHNAYDFKQAKDILVDGICLANNTDNFHRLAELEVQYGDMCAYCEDRQETAAHWKIAADNFSSEDIYDAVLGFVYRGSAMLLCGDFKNIGDILSKLSEYYERSYPYLKFVADDFRLNYLILCAVKNKTFDENLHKIIKSNFNRFRGVMLAYDVKRYLFATYKTLVYLKFILKNFSDGKAEKFCAERQLAYLLCEELIANYDWNKTNFDYFYPVFRDIAEIVGDNSEIFSNIIKHIPQKKMELFNLIAKKSDFDPTFAPPLKHGIFSDPDNKVNLFHNSYTW